MSFSSWRQGIICNLKQYLLYNDFLDEEYVWSDSQLEGVDTLFSMIE